MNPSRSVFEPPGEPEAPTNVTAPARDDPSLDPVLECWFELERYLEQRTRELNAEVRDGSGQGLWRGSGCGWRIDP